jgi:hypothetical protein
MRAVCMKQCTAGGRPGRNLDEIPPLPEEKTYP